MKHKLVLGLTILVAAVAIIGISRNMANNKSDTNSQQPIVMMEKENSVTSTSEQEMKAGKKEAVMEKQKIEEGEKESMMNADKVGMYKDYSLTALAEATKNGGKAVLFFWAAWCPYCKSANTEFMTNLNKIPNNVTVLKTNYDTEKELKIKYGITYQHTFVQVDVSGNQITKWNGGGIAELLNNLK